MTDRFPTTPMCSGEILACFEPTVRDSDVFTATVAKSGQTWLCTLLHHLKTRGRSPDFEGKSLFGVVPWLEIPYDPSKKERPPYDPQSRVAELDRIGDPRVFKMHVLWDEIPRPPGSRSKVLTITRDPRDLPYSMFCHLQALEAVPMEGSPPDFPTFFEGWLERGYFFHWVASFWPHRNDPNLLWLRYEDLRADPDAGAARIAEFLGWEIDPGERRRAVELASFEHMQRTEKSALLAGTTAFKADHRFVREGAVGRNRKHLTPQMEARIVERVRDSFPPDCADFLLAQG